MTKHSQVCGVLTVDCGGGTVPVFMFYHVGVTLVTVRHQHQSQDSPGGKAATPWDRQDQVRKWKAEMSELSPLSEF